MRVRDRGASLIMRRGTHRLGNTDGLGDSDITKCDVEDVSWNPEDYKGGRVNRLGRRASIADHLHL